MTFKSIEMSIGSDECGNGSFFGGITCSAVYVEAEAEKLLESYGANDSKSLSDDKILDIAKEIETNLIYSSVNITPEEYNSLIEDGYNAVSIKVYLHNKAIQSLLTKLDLSDDIPKIIDQFTTPASYIGYVIKEKEPCLDDLIFETKAESKYYAVAAASILARKNFLNQIFLLRSEMNEDISIGAADRQIKAGVKILDRYGLVGLRKTAKLHFKTTEKIKERLEDLKHV